MTATSDILRNDLRTVYLAIYDTFAMTIGEIADLPGVGNYRYARELTGVLTNQGLVAETEGGIDNNEVVYQTYPDTYDTIDRDEAERRIDDLLNRMIPATTTKPSKTNKKESKTMTTTATKTDFRHCGCGCNENVAGKSMYRPGHDARHAGNVARAAYALRKDGQTTADAEAQINSLPTDALQAKARGMIAGWQAKDNAKAARAAAKTAAKKAKDAEPEFTEGTVKKGRWEYPTRTYPGGVVEVNTKRDGSGEWVPQD